ncbi:MAG: hypothetical protein KC649_07325, partial [Candidatus Omnitrophica bacterium]|nr:hypothetical protein [Candidatus Omnitrophota bacterium]
MYVGKKILSIKSFTVSLVIMIVGLAIALTPAQADVFVLRSGERFKGKIIARSDSSYLIASQGKQRWVAFYDVKKIIKDPVVVCRQIPASQQASKEPS